MRAFSPSRMYSWQFRSSDI